MVLCRSPTLWTVEPASGGNSQEEEMEKQRQEKNGGTDRGGAAGVLPEDEGRAERSAGAASPRC